MASDKRPHSKGARTHHMEVWIENLKPYLPPRAETEPHPILNEPHFNKSSEKAIQ
ncbi:MAG: hypothetical protein IPP17_26695 [Bacteroidetes bacterium]|nr:hypothetical protein [Bacteroidota bacterium]